MENYREPFGKHGAYNPATLSWVDMSKFTVSNTQLEQRVLDIFNCYINREIEFITKNEEEQHREGTLYSLTEDINYSIRKHMNNYKWIICKIYGDPFDSESGYANLDEDAYTGWTKIDLEIKAFEFFLHNEYNLPEIL